jgi:hypothetical protein
MMRPVELSTNMWKEKKERIIAMDEWRKTKMQICGILRR